MVEPEFTVKIVDPDKPDDYLIIDLDDFDPEIMQMWPEQSEGQQRGYRIYIGEEPLPSFEEPKSPPLPPKSQNVLGPYGGNESKDAK